jgi:capsular polysaccharide transport system permease protein
LTEPYLSSLPAPLEAARQIRVGLQRMRSVLLALIFKEYKGHSSRGILTILLSLVQPLVRTIFFSIAWYATGRTTFHGVPAVLYIASGVFFYMIIHVVIQKLPAAIGSNQALLGFPQVKPLDPILSRFIVEIMLLLVSFGVFTWSLYWFLGIAEYVHYPLELIAVFFLTLTMGLGIGLLVGVYGHLYPGFRTSLSFLTLPLFFTSGAIHPVAGLSREVREALSWNPLFHIIEFVRHYWFGTRQAPETNIEYPLMIALLAIGFGTLIYYRKRIELVQR